MSVAVAVVAVAAPVGREYLAAEIMYVNTTC
jgi:hypothetical protein